MLILKVRFFKSCLHRLVRVRADIPLFPIVRKHSNKFSPRNGNYIPILIADTGCTKRAVYQITSFETRIIVC